MNSECCGVNGCKKSGFKGRGGLAAHRSQCQQRKLKKPRALLGKRPRSLLSNWDSLKRQKPDTSRSCDNEDQWEDDEDSANVLPHQKTNNEQGLNPPLPFTSTPRMRSPQPFEDILYTTSAPIEENSNSPAAPGNHNVFHQSEPDAFGMIRSYQPVAPSHDPEADITLSSTCQAPTLSSSNVPGVSSSASAARYQFAPFENVTIARLLQWQNNGAPLKSNAQMDKLVHDVIDVDGFDPDHLKDFRIRTQLSRLHQHTDQLGVSADDGWQNTTLELPMPCPGFRQKEVDAPKLKVTGLLWRNLTAVMKSAWSSKAAQTYHQKPHILKQQYEEGVPEGVRRAWSEVYNADGVNDEWKKICEELQKKNAKVDLEKYILVMLMIWSDSTHLAQFGTASMWPMYLYFGNQSKYIRNKPSSMAAHHVAYIPSVSMWPHVLSRVELMIEH
jgi:hypothetical protein